MNSQNIFRETQKTSKVAIAVLLMMFIGGFALWCVLYPVVYDSIIFWVGAVLMAIPGYIATESFGSLGLNAGFIKNLPRSARILFGVFWMLVCLLLFGLVLGLLSLMLEA